MMNMKKIDIILTVLLFGSVWGLSETVFNEALIAWLLPLRAALLTGMGFLIMGTFLGLTSRPALIIWVVLITVAAKEVLVPVLGCSLMCRANSCLAVALQGGLLAAGFALMKNRIPGRAGVQSITALSAAALSAVSFYYSGMHLAPCGYLLSFNQPGGLGLFMQREGLYWALAAAVFFPPGYSAGSLIKSRGQKFYSQYPAFYNSARVFAITASWAVILYSSASTVIK
jgi:hypothetical protein